MTQHRPAPTHRPSQVVHPKKARILAILSWVMAAAFVVMALMADPISWSVIGLAVAGAALAWVLIWRPKVTLDADGLQLVNPVRTVDIPWQRVRRVGSRWTLEVETEKGMQRAWAIGSSYRDPSGVDHSADVTGLGLLRKLEARRTGADPHPVKPEYAMGHDLQSVASTVRGARDAHADALADGLLEADPRPTTIRLEPLALAALAAGLLLPVLAWVL